MTTKQPEALRLAEYCEELADEIDETHFTHDLQAAAALLRTQHAEIERLTSSLKWEQNRAERIGTHGPGCEKWGSAHYECLLRKYEELENEKRVLAETLERCKEVANATTECYRLDVERKDALLRQCLKHVASNISMTSDGTEAEDLYDAIKEELQ